MTDDIAKDHQPETALSTEKDPVHLASRENIDTLGEVPAEAPRTDRHPSLKPELRAGKVWSPPTASRASRRPSLRSRRSFRGAFVNPLTNREMVYESTLERDAAHILIFHSDAKDVYEQPPAVNYTDCDGRHRSHTFDFLVEHKDETRTAIAVKPDQKISCSEIKKTLELIRSQTTPNFADRIALRTEKHITRDRAFNARLILRAFRTRDKDHIAAVMAIAGTLEGTVSLRSLLKATKNDGEGFLAVVCLIGDGVLVHVSPGRISYQSDIKRADCGRNIH